MLPRDRPRPHRLLHPAGAAGPVPPAGHRPSAIATPIPAIGRLGLWPITGATLARRRPASLTITHIGRLCAYQPSGARCQLPAHIEPSGRARRRGRSVAERAGVRRLLTPHVSACRPPLHSRERTVGGT